MAKDSRGKIATVLDAFVGEDPPSGKKPSEEGESCNTLFPLTTTTGQKHRGGAFHLQITPTKVFSFIQGSGTRCRRLQLRPLEAKWRQRTERTNPKHLIWPDRSSKPLQTSGIEPYSTWGNKLIPPLYRGDGRQRRLEERGRRAGREERTLNGGGERERKVGGDDLVLI
jgi:hypothetical protein